MTQKTSWLTEAITEAVDEVMELLTEIFDDEEFGLGILEVKVRQEVLRQRFEEVARSVSLEEYEQLAAGFVQDFGEDEYQRQAMLMGRREQ